MLELVLRSNYFPKVPQVMSVLAFAVILYFAFTGSPHGDTNLAVAATWQIWWVLLPFFAVVLGRVWCSFCPISTVSGILLRLRRRPRRAGSSDVVRHGVWASGVLLLLLTWAMIAWRIDQSPAATAILLLVFLAAATTLELLFADRVWCKALCPIGAVIGLYSRLAPLQLRPREGTCAARCGRAANCHATLLSKQCLNDGPIAKLSSNRNCSLCGDCVKSCRHSSLELRFGWPEALATRPLAMSAAETVVLLLLIAVILLDLLRMTSWWPMLMRLLVNVAPSVNYNVFLALVILALAFVLLTAYIIVAWVGVKVTKRAMHESFVLFAAPYVAIVAAVHLGSELFHAVSHGDRPLLAVAMELGFAVDYPAVVRGAIYTQNPPLQMLEVALLLVAAILAVRAFWKASAHASVSGPRRRLIPATQGLLSILIAVAAAFLFISPMGMIH